MAIDKGGDRGPVTDQHLQRQGAVPAHGKDDRRQNDDDGKRQQPFEGHGGGSGSGPRLSVNGLAGLFRAFGARVVAAGCGMTLSLHLSAFAKVHVTDS